MSINFNLGTRLPSILMAAHYLESYIQEKGWSSPEEITLDIKDIYDTIIYPETEFTLITDVALGNFAGEKVLGKTVLDEKIILISPDIAPPNNDPRFPFTFAHEIGHAVLHQNCQNEHLHGTLSSFTNNFDPIERQANSFAAQLLMPHDLVKFRFYEQYNMKHPYIYTGRGVYWINGEKIHIHSLSHLCNKLAEPLTCFFSNVSKSSLSLTLLETGLINNTTHEKFLPNKTFIPGLYFKDSHDN